METSFSPEQMQDPAIVIANDILRKCVHCGFCTATCPTYVLLGDEADSPRGRIYMIKDMLEHDKPASKRVVKHIDRCLSCLSCTTTCPSGVDYMHLVDHARVHIESTFIRPLGDRLLRKLLARVVPNPALFRLSLWGARLGRPFKGLMPGRLKGMIAMAPDSMEKAAPCDKPQVFNAEGKKIKRIALMTGCAQKVLRPAINQATVRLLTRHGCEVVIAKGAGCCGALVHHMGKEDEALAAARTNVAAWMAEIENGGLDAIVINASGCGTTVKDYGFMLRNDPVWGKPAATVAALARDVTEVVCDLQLVTGGALPPMVVAYHSACSMQHGQKLVSGPKRLLEHAGFSVREPAEGHLCCGSAGTYNLLQPELAGKLKNRKIINLEEQFPEVIATGNIGCLVQIASGTDIPVVHTVELLDWASGGPKPKNIS
ncbi:MAG: glycolate oxidase subunit GlcF [Rhodospirillaceae bacterium]|nr:glycolate oxidase subunit GlcF [Rhodospirillaceae bacterium]